MRSVLLWRAAMVAACLLLGIPAWGASDESVPPRDLKAGNLAVAGGLVEAGRFGEAFDILQPLALEQPKHQDVLFLLGLTAAQVSQHSDVTEEYRETLLDISIASFRSILIDNPELVRVHLELARAFFLQREDGLAREHFERVLAGEVPDVVAANVHEFLSIMRARRRWNMHFGFALQPDTNIGGASNERIIYIGGLPFVRDVDELTTSGVGLSVWTGGEYQYPFEGSPVRLRMGGNVSRKEYTGGEFDEMTLSAHTGPRWLVDRDTDLSLLANLRQRWVSDKVDNDEWGGRIEFGRRVSPIATVNAQTSASRQQYRDKKHLDGWSLNLSLSGAWTAMPIVRINGTIGYAKQHTESERWRNSSKSLGDRGAGAAPVWVHGGRQCQAGVEGLRGRLGDLHARRRAAGGSDPEP